MTLKRLLKVVPIGLAISTAAVPVFIAEGSLHIHNRIVPDSHAADYFARQNDATWQPAVLKAADGIQLQAWFFRPAEFNGAAVLLLHGVGDTRLGMTGHLQYLLRNGYAALMPDARGHGSSGGDLVTYGLKEARDTAMWVQWLDGQPGVERIYGLGESMGAGVLIQSLAYHPDFRAIVAECSFATFEDVAEYRVGSRLLPVVAWPVVRMASWYSRLRYGVDVTQASPADALRRSNTPVLLIHGTADVNIPPQESRDLHAANPSSTVLWEVRGATHVGAQTVEPHEYQRRVLSWFGDH
jgi:dipeptidyl aminopeptidase/acylaminoacyl peptidase